MLSVTGLELHPITLSLQNGYINFDKRRKVRGVHWPDARYPRKGSRRAKPGVCVLAPAVCGLLPRSLLSFPSYGGSRTNVVAMSSNLTLISSGGCRGSSH